MKETNKSINGTCFFSVVVPATVAQMKSILGTPEVNGTVEDKSQFDWYMETDGGEVFTVYDWKEGRLLTEDVLVNWHVGSFTKEASEAAEVELLAALKKIK